MDRQAKQNAAASLLGEGSGLSVRASAKGATFWYWTQAWDIFVTYERFTPAKGQKDGGGQRDNKE